MVGVFPSEASAVRLMGAFLMEENDRWAAQRKVCYGTDYDVFQARLGELVSIARNQARLAKAA